MVAVEDHAVKQYAILRHHAPPAVSVVPRAGSCRRQYTSPRLVAVSPRRTGDAMRPLVRRASGPRSTPSRTSSDRPGSGTAYASAGIVEPAEEIGDSDVVLRGGDL